MAIDSKRSMRSNPAAPVGGEMSERCAKWGNAMQGRCAFDNMHEGPCDFEPSASEGERVEQILDATTVVAGKNGINRYVGPHFLNLSLDDSRFPEGATVEIIARLVPTKGGADHE